VRNNSTWAPSLPSPTNWPRQAWNPLLTGLVFVSVVILFLAASFFYVFVATANGWIDPRHAADAPPTQQVILQLVGFAPVTVFLLLALPTLARMPLRELGFRAPTPRDVRIALSAALAMVLLVNGLGTLISGFLHRNDTEQAILLLHQMKTPFQQLLFFSLACVFAPFYEELTFRVFIFNALSRYLPVWIAILISATIFGLLHAVSDSTSPLLTVALPLTVGGIVLAYVYSVTKCFWANVITHAVFNSVSVASFYVFHLK